MTSEEVTHCVVLSVGRGAEVDELFAAFDVVLGEMDDVPFDAVFVDDTPLEDFLALLEEAVDLVVVINVLANELLGELLVLPEDLDPELVAVFEPEFVADFEPELLVDPPVKLAHGFSYPTPLC